MCWTAGQVSNAEHAAPEEGKKQDTKISMVENNMQIYCLATWNQNGWFEEEIRSLLGKLLQSFLPNVLNNR